MSDTVSIAATEEIQRRWGANVRQRREELRMSQVGLAEATGYSQAAISRIEKGLQDIPLAQRLALAEALEISHDELFATGGAAA